MRKVFLLFLALSTPAFCQHDHRLNDVDMSRAPLLKGLGDIHHKVSTENELAQKYFDQGLALDYAFNHAEAERAFIHAQKLDPKLAMAWWGQALVLGSNINDPVTPEREDKAYAAIQKAKELSASVSASDKDYIDALAVRYSNEKERDRAKLDRAYSDALAALAKKYPDDPDAITLHGASLMEMMPWDYYLTNGDPKPEIVTAQQEFETVIKRWPRHTGAPHYYIHAVEASSTPERGLPSAEILGSLAPAAGHLVHMPSHIYVRTGHYYDAMRVNESAVAADEDYISQCRAQGIYPVRYYPHNMHMLSFAAAMEGRSQEAIANASKIVTKVPADMAVEHPALGNMFVPLRTMAMLRFGHWDEVLALPEPNAKLLIADAIWRYGRGVAFVRTGKLEDAGKELAAIDTIAANPDLEHQYLRRADGETLVSIAQNALAGELAENSKQYDAAIATLEKAVAAQDSLHYSEPEDWYFPVRHVLGAVLLEANRPAQAEKVYLKDLEQHRENGWALYGLAKALRAQGKNDDAERAKARFGAAWMHADVKITASRF